MKTAYLDAFSGLSGDMIVGAMLDLGADFQALREALAALPISGHRTSAGRKSVNGIAAMKFTVEVTQPQPERHLSDIRRMIESMPLDNQVSRRAVAIFEALGAAEAKVHQTTPERVHFHEVGAVDSIIDVIGCAWALEQLDIGDVIVSTLPMGAGLTSSRHGIIPVPAPATAELLAGFPVRFIDGAEAEMVTPTGAAFLRAIARPAPAGLTFEIERVGYGAGTRELRDRPNLLRIFLGREREGFGVDAMVMIETNIDDLNPQIYEHLTDRLLAAGARDVTITPTLMKKSRPGVIISVLAEPGNKDELGSILFAETSTIGLRFYPITRLKLQREVRQVNTRFGAINVKLSGYGDKPPITLSPEYEDCRRAANEHGVPLRLVMEEAQAAARADIEAHRR